LDIHLDFTTIIQWQVILSNALFDFNNSFFVKSTLCSIVKNKTGANLSAHWYKPAYHLNVYTNILNLKSKLLPQQRRLKMGKFHKELNAFPDAIKTCLPKAASSVSSDLSGWVLSGGKSQVVFWEVKKGFAVSGHSHPHDEWGVVITGSCSLTIGDETKTYHAGQEFYVPAGIEHYSTMSDNYRAVDFFASPDWIKAVK
jgi:mannose-6-phosphate isomerase-like protein (cupin superfamily)